MNIPQPTDGNQIQLTPERVCCRLHMSLFKSAWPNGYAVFVANAFAALKECPSFLNEMDGTVAGFNAAFSARPICCQLARHDPDLLLVCLQKTQQVVKGVIDAGPELWPERVCDVCRRKSAGCAVDLTPKYAPMGRPRKAVKYKHICLDCISHVLVTSKGPVPPTKGNKRWRSGQGKQSS